MSYNEFHADALEKRGLALCSKRFALRMRDEALEKKNELNAVLFGDGDNHGIMSVAFAYYRMIALGNGKVTSTPAMTSMAVIKSQFITQLEKSITPEGDGEGGIHPPDPKTPAAGLEKTDEGSVWLNGFSLEDIPTGTGVTQRLDALLEQIGNEASNNGNNRGPYQTLELAQAAVASGKGSGLLGLRTENSEIQGTEPSYTVGINGVDKPDTFSSKTAFMRAIDDLISIIAAWGIQSAVIQGILNYGSDILTEYKIEKPDGDLEALEALEKQAGEFLEELHSFFEYFNGFAQTDAATNSANRAAFNGELERLKDYAGTIRTAVSARCDAIPALLGDASKGLRKHLIFWANEAAKKPDGPYAMFAMAESMIAGSIEKITEENKRLNFFDRDKTRWIETPSSVAAYQKFIRGLDGSIKETKLVISWGMVMAANKYKVLVKKISDLYEISNTPWDEDGAWVTEITPATGYAVNELEIAVPDEAVLARVIAYDSDEGVRGGLGRMDTENTRSPQSPVTSDEIPFEQKEDWDGSTLLLIDKAFGIRDMQYILVNDLITRVAAVSENEVLLDGWLDAVTSVKLLFGNYIPEP